LGRFDEAEQAIAEVQKINPDIVQVHVAIFLLAFVRGDQAAMDREAQWAKGRPEEADFMAVQAAHAMVLGKVKQSEEISKNVVEQFKNQNRKENAANVLMGLAGSQAILGKTEDAR